LWIDINGDVGFLGRGSFLLVEEFFDSFPNKDGVDWLGDRDKLVGEV